jgi:hypothetical protein
MKRTRSFLLMLGIGLLAVVPLASGAAANDAPGLQPVPVPTHGWICVSNQNPFVHICVP